MLPAIRESWQELKEQAPGERFEWFHEQQRTKPFWVKAVYVVLSVVLFGVGVILAFIPGPAVLFFALSAALAGTQSLWVARLLDRGEVKGREIWKALRARWRKRKRRPRAGHGGHAAD